MARTCIQRWTEIGAVSAGATIVLGLLALNMWNLTIDAKALGSTETCTRPPMRAFLIGSVVCSAISLSTCGLAPPALHLVFIVLGHVWLRQAHTEADPLYGETCALTAPLLIRTSMQSLVVLWCTMVCNVICFMCYGYCPLLLGSS
ncbi:hypothetical protein KP509_05G064300 [Ceratopteris richardii]|uniref:Uncharacterized protein n=1 Tax=Ceratopteris richardii TaxID=49495 RepID=A0A8T2URB5_CERRI|nr:hypothetical protein KP509_05G064300 [Ceratopteris richardii]